MTAARAHFLLLNVAHFLDHFFMLIFATAAALALSRDWGMGYGELIPYATPGFVAFAVFAIPAGWLADRWSRRGMMAIFYVGIGLSSMATALAETPLQMAAGLFAIGVFAAIYHPVGIALVIQGRTRTGIPIAVNGIFGNLGVASAALITALMIETAGWRAAFVWPGLATVALGGVYLLVSARAARAEAAHAAAGGRSGEAATLTLDRATLIRVLAIIIFSTAGGGLIFQSTTFSLPKVFDERLAGLALSPGEVGGWAFLVFAIAAVGQLIVGFLVDRYPARHIFMTVAFVQATLFAMMPGLTGVAALAVALVFMLAVFGQIPINDVLVGRIAKSEWRSRVYALRYIVNFAVVAGSLPLIGWLYDTQGFDALFGVLSAAAAAILVAVTLLPSTRLSLRPAE